MPLSPKTLRPAARRTLRWLLRDEFLTDEASPITTPRAAEPGPGTAVALQTSRMSIADGALVCVGDGVVTCGAYYDQLDRAAGLTLVARVRSDSAFDTFVVGWQSTTFIGTDVGTPVGFAISLRALSELRALVSTSTFVAIGPTMFVPNDTWCSLVVVLRAAGAFWLYRIDGEANWRLAYVSNLNSFNGRAFLNNTSATVRFDHMRVPERLWSPTPLASDSFDRADAAGLGVSDGLGVEETCAAGAAWTELSSGCHIVSNTARLASGQALATLDVATSDVVLQAALTTSSNDKFTGLALRMADANNGWVVGVKENTLSIIELSGGVYTTRAGGTPTIAASAAGTLLVAAEDETIRAMLGATSAVYTSAAGNKTATRHGLWFEATTTGAVAWWACWERFPTDFPSEIAA